MEIIHSSDAIHKEKPDGTRVDYYLQKEYEVHYNEVPSKTTQEWHSHAIVEEIIFILDGQLQIQWLKGNEKNEETVKKGDMICVENNPHTFINTSDEDAKFVVFKLVLNGKDNSKIFKEDKTLVI